MNKHTVLEKLRDKSPLFSDFPPRGHFTPRIMGLEFEFGGPTLEGAEGQSFLKQINIPRLFYNGGRAYIDLGHLEGCTPECADLVSLVAYAGAVKILCRKLRNPPIALFCINHDFQSPPSTFGFHENYFTRAPRSEWWRLVSFLVARTVISGTGRQYPDGSFGILQRAPFLEPGVDDHPHKTIITSRDDSLTDLPGWNRLHLLLGDSPMCPMTLFLSIGFTSLVVEMLERNALPDIEYNHYMDSVRDIRDISSREENWIMNGITKGPKGVVDILAINLRRAKELFMGRDAITNILIWALEDTLEKLGSDPSKLFGRLDWVTKRFLLREFGQEVNNDPEILMSQDLEYHCLDPDRGLNILAGRAGLIERVVSRGLTKQAMAEPPRATRALIRGAVAKIAQQEFLGDWRVLPDYSPWDTIAYEWHGRSPKAFTKIGFPIGNPFKNYMDDLPKILDEMRS